MDQQPDWMSEFLGAAPPLETSNSKESKTETTSPTTSESPDATSPRDDSQTLGINKKLLDTSIFDDPPITYVGDPVKKVSQEEFHKISDQGGNSSSGTYSSESPTSQNQEKSYAERLQEQIAQDEEEDERRRKLFPDYHKLVISGKKAIYHPPPPQTPLESAQDISTSPKNSVSEMIEFFQQKFAEAKNTGTIVPKTNSDTSSKQDEAKPISSETDVPQTETTVPPIKGDNGIIYKTYKPKYDKK